MRHWFVAEATRKGLTVPAMDGDVERQIIAGVAAAALGFEVHVPLIQRYRKVGNRVCETAAPRFGVYIFVRFDRDYDPWPELMTDRTHHQYFKRVLANKDGVPVPVPEKAIDAIKAYRPPKIEQQTPVVYQPGQRVTCIMAGRRMEAVFVEYCGGNRPFIRTWILGAEHLVEVSSAQLEPLDLDSVVASTR